MFIKTFIVLFFLIGDVSANEIKEDKDHYERLANIERNSMDFFHFSLNRTIDLTEVMINPEHRQKYIKEFIWFLKRVVGYPLIFLFICTQVLIPRFKLRYIQIVDV